MNIEDLSKQQLLLLMILVNFVVSIATGVLTVSFLNQAPTVVTQTVNQIVDHTIQTVTQVPGLTAPSQPSVEDLLSTAIAAESARSVTIHAGASTTPAVAVGVYLPKSKAVATLAGASLPKEATIVFFDGSSAGASLSRSSGSIAIYGFSDSAKLYSAPAASPVALKDVRPGQTVITLKEDGSALTGIVSKVDPTGIYTSIGTTVPGSAAVNSAGNLVGISSGSTGVFVTADEITALLTATSTAQ